MFAMKQAIKSQRVDIFHDEPICPGDIHGATPGALGLGLLGRKRTSHRALHRRILEKRTRHATLTSGFAGITIFELQKQAILLWSDP